jgi:hypothetical protein
MWPKACMPSTPSATKMSSILDADRRHTALLIRPSKRLRRTISSYDGKVQKVQTPTALTQVELAGQLRLEESRSAEPAQGGLALLGLGTQPGKGDGDEPTDRGLGGQAAGRTEGVQAVVG